MILDEFDVEQDEAQDRQQTPETEPPVAAREPSAAELAVADAKQAMRELEQELARSPATTPGGETIPAVDDPAAGLVAPPAAAPADESGQPVGLQTRAYADPAGRFRCELPPHWRMWEQRTPSESRLRLVSDRDEILVVVRGEDQPVLQPDDQLLVEAELLREYQLRHLGAMTDKETTRWRMVGAGRGLQVDLKTRENGRDGWTRLIEHRLHGRSCLFELNVSNLAQRAVLELIFESFLLNFEVLPPPGPTE